MDYFIEIRIDINIILIKFPKVKRKPGNPFKLYASISSNCSNWDPLTDIRS